MFQIRSCFARGHSRSFAALAGVFALASTVPAIAAINVYLIVDGIQGTSTTRAGAIDLQSFSVGVSNASSTTARAGSTGQIAAKPDCSDLSVMKQLDAASPPLIGAALTGQTIKTVKVIYTKPSADAQVDFFTLTLGNVKITSVQESGSNETPEESISFSAQTYTFSFIPQKPDGSPGAAITAGGTC
jgi:type VI secretion system secreted protein Hcp